MKKILLLPLLLFSPLFALPIGNPMDASLYKKGVFLEDCYDGRCCNPCDPCFSWCDAWSFRLGFYDDYVFNRNMELKNHGDRDIKDFEIFTNSGYLALNICDRLDIFGTLGATNINMDADLAIFVPLGQPPFIFSIETETAFSWSVGGRLTIWNCDCFYFGIEGQYFYTKANIDLIDFGDDGIIVPDEPISLICRSKKSPS